MAINASDPISDYIICNLRVGDIIGPSTVLQINQRIAQSCNSYLNKYILSYYIAYYDHCIQNTVLCIQLRPQCIIFIRYLALYFKH